MVASTVEIITKSYKDEPAARTCDGSPEFTLEPADKTTRGTEIILHAEDSLEFLEEAKIKELLNKYNKFMPVAIKFGTKTEKIEQKRENVDPEDKKKHKTVEVDNINNPNPAWTKLPTELSDEDYKKLLP
jgi:molecular chaperone HtpG